MKRQKALGIRQLAQSLLKPIAHCLLPDGDRAQQGFTLLLAALISSIVLALGAAIFEIAQKEVMLSSIGRDSQFAFYVADTAAECALYWDFRFGYFGTTTAPAEDLTCDGQLMQTTVPSGPYPYTVESQKMNFFQDASQAGGYCAQVFITKSLEVPSNIVRTEIHADGYSVNCDSIYTSPRSLQRSVELHY